MSFTPTERDYLLYQPLGRLATIGPRGTPQVTPVSFRHTGDGTIAIRGENLSATQKWRNIQRNPAVAFVVDDLPSQDPWIGRGIEIRGNAETVSQPGPDGSRQEVIIVTPIRILTWGLTGEGRASRTLPAPESV